MSEQIIKQPDGRYAIFDSTVDQIVLRDATADEITEREVSVAIERAAEQARRQTPQRIARADRDGTSGYKPFGLTWTQAVERHRAHDGPDLDDDAAWIEG